MNRFFVAIAFILLPQNVIAEELRPHDVFNTDDCIIYDSFPADMVVDVVWTGECEEGKASGTGVALFVADQNEVVFQYEGSIVKGLLSGRAFITWPRSGTQGTVDYNAGVISGTGLVLRTLKDGSKLAVQSDWNDNNPIRNENEKLFFQASDPDGYAQQASLVERERSDILEDPDESCAVWRHKAEAGIRLRSLSGTSNIHSFATVSSISSVTSCYAFENELEAEALWMEKIASDAFPLDEIEKKQIATLVERYAESILKESETASEKEDAAQWYVRAASFGSRKAQNYVGLWHSTGRYGLVKDLSLASHFYRLAAEQGLAVAQFNLGFTIERAADGSSEKLEEALTWYLKAHDQGYDSASLAVATLLSDSSKQFYDLQRAQNIFEQQSAKGNAFAQARIAFILADQGNDAAASDALISLWKNLNAANSGSDEPLRQALPVSILALAGTHKMSQQTDVLKTQSVSNLLMILFRAECGQITDREEREKIRIVASELFSSFGNCIDSKYVYPDAISDEAIGRIVRQLADFYDLKSDEYSYSRYVNRVNNYLLARNKSVLSFSICSESGYCDILESHPINYLIMQTTRNGEWTKLNSQISALIQKNPTLQSKLVFPEGYAIYLAGKDTHDVGKYYDTVQSLPDHASVRVFRCENRCKGDISSAGGSGVFIDSQHILTNYHVINGHSIPSMEPGGDRIVPNQNYKIFIQTTESPDQIPITRLASFIRDLPSARFIDGSPEADLAILKLDRPISGVFVVPIEKHAMDSDQKLNFSPVVAYGFPGLLDVKIHPAINLRQFTAKGSIQGVSGWNRANLPISFRFMNSGGMSGGPILNSCGNLLGLTTLGGIHLGANDFDRSGKTQGLSQIYDLLLRNPQIDFRTSKRFCLKTGSIFLREIVDQYRASSKLAAIRFPNRFLPVTATHIGKGYLVFSAPASVNVGDKVYVDGLLGETLEAEVLNFSTENKISLARVTGDHSRFNNERVILSSKGSASQSAFHFAGIIDFDVDEVNSKRRSGTTAAKPLEERGAQTSFEVGRFIARNNRGYGVFGRSTLGAPIFDKCGYLTGIITGVDRDNTNSEVADYSYPGDLGRWA